MTHDRVILTPINYGTWERAIDLSNATPSALDLTAGQADEDRLARGVLAQLGGADDDLLDEEFRLELAAAVVADGNPQRADALTRRAGTDTTFRRQLLAQAARIEQEDDLMEHEDHMELANPYDPDPNAGHNQSRAAVERFLDTGRTAPAAAGRDPFAAENRWSDADIGRLRYDPDAIEDSPQPEGGPAPDARRTELVGAFLNELRAAGVDLGRYGPHAPVPNPPVEFGSMPGQRTSHGIAPDPRVLIETEEAEQRAAQRRFDRLGRASKAKMAIESGALVSAQAEEIEAQRRRNAALDELARRMRH